MPNVTPLRPQDPDRIGQHRLTGRMAGMPGAGPVYLATAADGTEVTLRLLRGDWTHDAAARDRFAAEAASARRVPPFCAARILDAGVEADQAYLVSEYIAGKSLLEAVADDGRLGGPELEALAIGSATGLASVHQAGLVHGGFGPEHVIMSVSGPRIIDFGITPPYGPATPAADMLAWAQTMVFASMGRPPTRLSDLDVLPGLLRQAVAGCLAGDPASRPTARSVVLDLLGDAEPPAGALAEGSRRAAQASQAAARAAAGGRESPHARGSRSGPGSRSGQDGRAARQHGQHQAAGARERRQDRPDHEQPAHEQPTHERASHDHSGARRRGSGRRGLSVAAAVVVIAAVGFVMAHVIQDASPRRGAASSPASSTSPVSSTVSSVPSPPAPSTVPAAFAGSWSGQAKQVNPSDVFNVRLSLPAGAADGSVSYSSTSFSCAGRLNLRSSSHARLTLHQDIVTGQGQCANGVVTLSRGAGGILLFRFRGKTGPAASGTLTKS